MFRIFVLFAVILLNFGGYSEKQNRTEVEVEHTIAKRALPLLFPRASVLQFTIGLSVPLVLPSRTIILSWCMQQNIDLPWNLGQLMTRIIQAKAIEAFDISREVFYRYAANVLDSMGLEGEECLFRLICDIAEYPLHLGHKENLLEEIVHYALTPSLHLEESFRSSPSNETFTSEILFAENIGKNKGKCREEYSKCSVAIADLITAKYNVG